MGSIDPNIGGVYEVPRDGRRRIKKIWTKNDFATPRKTPSSSTTGGWRLAPRRLAPRDGQISRFRDPENESKIQIFLGKNKNSPTDLGPLQQQHVDLLGGPRHLYHG